MGCERRNSDPLIETCMMGRFSLWPSAEMGNFSFPEAMTGMIKIWKAGDWKMLASLVHLKEGDWITFTPSGYHVTTEGAARRIVWREGNNSYNGDESVGAELTSD